MKLLLGMFVIVGILRGAPTTVTDHILDSSGNPLSGMIRITPVVRFTSQGNQVYGATIVTQVRKVDGLFTVPLLPTDTATPQNIYYVVRYSLNGNPGASPTEYWFVPTSANPVGLSTVRSTPTANPLTMFSVIQLECPSTCFPGQSIVWNGTVWTNGVAGVPCTLTATVSTVCTHNLGSLNVGVNVYDNAGKESRAYKDITVTGINTVLITFSTNFTGTAYIK